MKLTIGMASYNNYLEVWFTIQALRMYQDLTDVELLILDNYGCDRIKNFIVGWAGDKVKYVRWTERQGTAAAKNRLFIEASGEWVFCIDSHVMLVPGAVAKLKEWLKENPNCTDLLQGPILWNDLKCGADSFKDVWSGGMWGQWENLHHDRTLPPYEIPMMGMGLFGCRKDAWLGFNPAFKGFGGEEGYIHEKYRKAGRKTLCLPWLQWLHFFKDTMPDLVGYVPSHADKMHNYIVGFQELGLDLTPVYEHFKIQPPRPVSSVLGLYNEAICTVSDINEHVVTFTGLAKGKHVTEFGVRQGISTVGWLHGAPSKLVSYDINSCDRLDILNHRAKELSVDFEFRIGDSTQIDIGPTDILFIDTIHTETQLLQELTKHESKVSELIVLHDTQTFGEVGEDGGHGLNFAIREFLKTNTKSWEEFMRYDNNNGLTILKRK
jgi:glycosyltransferase involved in cell wall biosynthesis